MLVVHLLSHLPLAFLFGAFCRNERLVGIPSVQALVRTHHIDLLTCHLGAGTCHENCWSHPHLVKHTWNFMCLGFTCCKFRVTCGMGSEQNSHPFGEVAVETKEIFRCFTGPYPEGWFDDVWFISHVMYVSCANVPHLSITKKNRVHLGITKKKRDQRSKHLDPLHPSYEMIIFLKCGHVGGPCVLNIDPSPKSWCPCVYVYIYSRTHWWIHNQILYQNPTDYLHVCW